MDISPGGRGGLIPNCPEWIPWRICSAASNRGWTGSCGSGRRAPIPAGHVPQALWAVSLSEVRCELLILTFISLLKGESWESLGAWSLLSNGWTKKVEKSFYRIMEYPEWYSQTRTSPLAQAADPKPTLQRTAPALALMPGAFSPPAAGSVQRGRGRKG